MPRPRTSLALCVLAVLMLAQIGLAQKQKVILDTDIGSDIDDAFAVALLISSPEFEVLGITTDYGNTPARARIVERMLRETGRGQIPVAVGEKTNDAAEPQFTWAEQFEGYEPVDQSASDFIIEKLREHPGEVVLFTIGPVTNLGNVAEKAPDALSRAKKIYSMFGSFYMGYGSHPVPDREWNVRADAEASRAFNRAAENHVYAGLDVTTFVELGPERRRELFLRHSPLTDALAGLYTLWEHETPTLYDPVAIGMHLWPELFETREAHVEITDEGYTVIDESQPPNAVIGVSIDEDAFMDRLIRRLKRGPIAGS